jgi:putative endonuclease
MFYVYVLGSEDSRRLYIGYTADLKRRIREHGAKKTWTTKRMGAIKLIFYEAFLVKEDAQRRESYFKTTKGRKTLRLMLRESLK